MAISDFDKELGRRVAYILEELYPNIDKKEIAELIGVKPSNLSEMFSGKRHFQVEMLYKIAERLDCSVDFLLGRSDILSMEEDIQNACFTTGLSEGAIKHLKFFKGYPDMIAALNDFITSKKLIDFTFEFANARLKIAEINKKIKELKPIADREKRANLRDMARFYAFIVIDQLTPYIEDALGVIPGESAINYYEELNHGQEE